MPRQPSSQDRALRFRAVAARPGGATSLLTTQAVLEAAAHRIEALGSRALEDISERLARVRCTGRSNREVYADAHDIRGIAAIFKFPGVGAAAAILCRLVESFPDAAPADHRLVDLIGAAMQASLANPADPLADRVITACAEAVDAELARQEQLKQTGDDA